jgi:cephalosporin-C deacetylase-like acetyl esterase
MDALAALPPAPDLTPNPLRSTDFGTVYDLHLTSLGPYRIFAYYCVPHGDGPFPVLYHTPGYGSVVHVPAYEERQRYVVVSLCHRGQRLSDQPFAAAYPGLLTTGIDDPAQYVYRGIVADCCRVVDFLVERPEVDTSRIAITGDDLALITAALRPQVDALYYTPGPFYMAETLVPATSAYPLEEINDYVRTHGDQADAVWETLSYFEPRHFVPRVQADTLLVTGVDGERVAPLIDAFPTAPEQYVGTSSGYRDGVHQATWIAERYGFAEPILPRQWQ